MTPEAVAERALFCPKCEVQHVDEGEWATRPHHTHLCLSCKHEWRLPDYVRGTAFNPYEVFGGAETARAWEGAPLGWSTWIHNNAACLDEFQFERRKDGLRLQATRSGVLVWFERSTAACIEGEDFAAVLAMAKKIHEWCKAAPKEDWV